MDILTLIGIALGLAADACCTAIGIGTGKRFPGQTFRLAFHFGLFQALMPFLGWLLGSQVVHWVRAWDHWLAGGIVTLLAARMLIEAFRQHCEENAADPTRGWSLVSLSVATSIDALAMGLGVAVLGVRILPACLIIGVITGGLTFLGIRFGRRMKSSFGRWVQVGGAVLLLAVAYRLFQI